MIKYILRADIDWHIKDEWAYIPDYNRKYIINFKGIIMYRNKKGEFCKLVYNRCGGEYWKARLNGKPNKSGSRNEIWYKVHRLMAITFLPNPNNYPCINHKDGNKDNNNLENLEWCTYSQNSRHARDELGALRNKLSIEQAEAIRSDVLAGKYANIRAIVDEYAIYGVNSSIIYSLLRNSTYKTDNSHPIEIPGSRVKKAI